MKSLSLPPKEWQVGKSKVFIRQKVYEPLEDRRHTTIVAAAIKIQALYRMHRHRKGIYIPTFFCNIHLYAIPVSIFALTRTENWHVEYFYRIPEDICCVRDNTELLPWLEASSSVYQKKESHHYHPVQCTRNVCQRGKETPHVPSF